MKRKIIKIIEKLKSVHPDYHYEIFYGKEVYLIYFQEVAMCGSEYDCLSYLLAEWRKLLTDDYYTLGHFRMCRRNKKALK